MAYNKVVYDGNILIDLTDLDVTAGDVVSGVTFIMADGTKAVGTITIPTKTSDLINDSGFISSETDPTVPSWAKASSKPSYTASEVGALPSDTPILSTSPTLSSTGLSPYSSRVSILKGGVYKFGKWRFVQLDLLVASSLSANNYWVILTGFDVPITDYSALGASVRGQNNGLLSAYINSSGNLFVETDDVALSANWSLEITGWYIAS